MTNGQARAGAYLLYRAFHPRHLGAPSAIPEGPWARFSEAPSDYWSNRVFKIGAINGDAIEPSTEGFVRCSPEPLLGLVSHTYASVPSGLGLGGVRSLAVELFGKRDAFPTAERRAVAVSDNHLHGGLAYDRRALLTALVTRREKISWSRKDGDVMPREVVLSSAVRWSIWLLECLRHQGSWKLPPHISGSSGMAEAWKLVTSGGFWPMVRAMSLGLPSTDERSQIFETQVWEADAHQINDGALNDVLQDWDVTNARPHGLIRDLIDTMKVLSHKESDDALEGGPGRATWPYSFTVNMIRATVDLFGDVPSWPGEGFTRFQSHCGQASLLRKTILNSTDPKKSESLEIEAQSSSLYAAIIGYPSPYFLDGFELRREVDPSLNLTAMGDDILRGITRRWKTFGKVVSRAGTTGAHSQPPRRFCATVSFQRPRQGWEETYPSTPPDGTSRPVRRYADPWVQVHYAASVVLALRTARASFGDAGAFDRAVGSLDVSGIEIAHATWPYVSAINLLLEELSLSFTAHAGESFERSSTGIRTIGELFLGKHAPNRIGHASALDERMRRMITKQQLHNVGSSERYRFDDYLQDLCFTTIVRRRLGSMEEDAGVPLLRELTKSSGWTIEPETWLNAFLWLHTTAPVQFAIKAFESGHAWHDRENAKTLWRTIVPEKDLSFKHAVQQFAFGEVIDLDMTGRTPLHALNGIPDELERRLISYLESQRWDMSRWVLDQVMEADALIECCPTSNLALAGVREYEDHPVWGFLQSDLRFSINSDDPLVFGGFAGEELAALHAGFGSDAAELQRRLLDLSSTHDAHAVVPEVDETLIALATTDRNVGLTANRGHDPLTRLDP